MNTRSCVGCRNYSPQSDIVGECRASSPSPQFHPDGSRALGEWPLVPREAWCGRFNPACGGNGRPTKVSDEAIIAVVQESCTEDFTDIESPVPKMAMKRGELADEIVAMGISRTPALRRLEKLVRQGRLQQGPNPWPRKYPTPGIYIWVEPVTKMPGGVAERGVGAEDGPEMFDVDEKFLAHIRTQAPDIAHAKSLRTLHSLLPDDHQMSLATASRRMIQLRARGLVRRESQGYFAAPEAVEV